MTSSSIMLITTGGTIGSTIESDSINVSQGQQQLRTRINKLCQHQSISLTTQAVFNKNSEDLTPTDWLVLIHCIEQLITAGVDKIIITHGSDTMAYTAAALAICFQQQPIKIVLTGSCFPLNHPRSDVSANLLGALAAISEPTITQGVYISWANQQGKTDVINAMDTKPMAFDELSFKGCFEQLVGTFKSPDKPFQRNLRSRCTLPTPLALQSSKIERNALARSGKRIIQLVCYPGIDIVQFCSNLAAGSCIILSLYHSGTASGQADNGGLLEALALFPELTFMLTPLPSAHITVPYASTVALQVAGALVYQNLQPHLLYVFVTLAMASGLEIKTILAHLETYQVRLGH